MKKFVLFVLLAAVAGMVSAQTRLEMRDVSDVMAPFSEMAYLVKVYQGEKTLFPILFFQKPEPARNSGYLYITCLQDAAGSPFPLPRTWQLQVPFAHVETVIYPADNSRVAYVNLVADYTRPDGMPFQRGFNVKIYCDTKVAAARTLTVEESERFMGEAR